MYPTIEQVNSANHEQLCQWHRFLSSPGSWAIDSGREEFDEAMAKEVPVMSRIAERYKEMGGMTPEISKRIGL